MLLINTYITEFYSNGKYWAGPDIIACSFEQAQKYIICKGLNYLTITGKLYFRINNYEFN